MILETERLLVQPLVAGDLKGIHRILDAAFGEGRLAADPAALAERAEWLEWTRLSAIWHGRLYQPPYGERAVVLKATGALIGAVGYVPCLMPFDQLPELRGNAPETGLSTPEFGLFWAIDAAHRRRGYATEAARALIDHAFGAPGLKRIVATTEYDNIESECVMRKLGMTVLRNPRSDPPWMQVVGVLDNPKIVDGQKPKE